jgi:hypothetical protein
VSIVSTNTEEATAAKSKSMRGGKSCNVVSVTFVKCCAGATTATTTTMVKLNENQKSHSNKTNIVQANDCSMASDIYPVAKDNFFHHIVD